MDFYTSLIGAFVAGVIIGRITKQSDSPAVRIGKPIAVELPQDVEHRIKELASQGRVIEAIKLLRDTTDLGLKESKELVDQLKSGQSCDIRSLIERHRLGQ
jgi:hypothetical protein